MIKQLFKIYALFTALFLTSILYVVGILGDMQYKVEYIENMLALAYKELEYYKNESSNMNYDDELAYIYNKINELYENNKQDVPNIDTDDNVTDNTNSKEENTEDKAENTENKTENTENKTENIEDKKEPIKQDGQNNNIYEDMKHLYYGRLYIPDLNINVALYYGYQQHITDRIDSANIFFFGNDKGFTIADHNNQEFSKLLNVKTGISGYIEHRDFGRINIECIDVFTGYNNGYYIVDKNGVNAMNREDYMMYTCLYSSNEVLICLWKTI